MNTQVITFQADEQCLVKTGGIDKYASDTASYIEAQFTLGENWSGYDQISAIWQSRYGTKRSVLDTEGVCFVPWQMLTKRSDLLVNLVGSIADNDVLTDRLTTFAIKALEISQDVPIDADTPTPITPSEYEQFVATVAADADRAEAAKLDARESAAAANDSALLASQSAQSASESAESASQSAESASQSAEEAEQASQSVLGLTATASVDSSVGTPSVAVTVETVGDHKVMDFDFHNLKGEQGEQGIQGEKGEQGERGETGASGADGFSPTVEVTPTTDGHEVTITDKDGEHTFEVLNGTVEDIYPFLPTDSASGSIASFSDGANDVPVTDLVVDITPKQDLNGQDAPYPAGGGKNKLPSPNNITASSGLTVTNDNGKLTINGTTSGGTIRVDIDEFTFATSGQKLSFLNSFTNATFRFYYQDTMVDYFSLSFTNRTIAESSLNLMQGRTVDRYDIIINEQTLSNATISPMVLGVDETNTFAPYSNICPISGWTGAVVSRTGINVWDEEWENGRFNLQNGGKSGGNGIRSKNKISVIPNATYYLTRGNYANASSFLILYYDANENFISYEIKYGTTATITIPSNAHFINLNIQTSVAITTYNNDISINYPSTDTSYHAYQGQTYPISWATEAGTVYGGTLDVTTGLLTVDRAMVDLGSLSFWKYAENYGFLTNLSGAKPFATEVSTIICSKYATNRYNINPPDYTIALGGWSLGTTLLVADSTYGTDVTAFINGSVGVQLVYELATPITYQLSATEVRTLLGDNNIWADTGDTEVTYKADIQKYIDKQISAVLNA